MSKLLPRIRRAILSPSHLYRAFRLRAWKCAEILRAAAIHSLGRQGITYTQIVICGCPRSGTSLLYNMFSASLDGFKFGEFEISSLDNIWKREDHVSKRPLDILIVDRLLRKNIHGKRIFVIVTVRDLRDVITSVHPVTSAGYYIDYESSLSPKRRPDDEFGRRQVGVRQIYDAIERAKSIPSGNLIFVRYEEFVEDPDRVQDELSARMGIRFSRRFSRFHEVPGKHAYTYTGRLKPVLPNEVRESSAPDPSRIGKWRADRHRKRIRDQFTAHPQLFRILREDGYESDDSWFDPYRSDTEAP